MFPTKYYSEFLTVLFLCCLQGKKLRKFGKLFQYAVFLEVPYGSYCLKFDLKKTIFKKLTLCMINFLLKYTRHLIPSFHVL